jgi:hypothetical protein
MANILPLSIKSIDLKYLNENYLKKIALLNPESSKNALQTILEKRNDSNFFSGK